MSARTSVEFLDSAAQTQRDRAATYDVGGVFGGERSMGRTVQAFNVITGRDLSESEGWLLLQVLKDVRDRTNGPHYDSLLDGVAYSSLKAEARMSEASQPPAEIHHAEVNATAEFRAKLDRIGILPIGATDAPVCSPALTADESTQNEAATVKDPLTVPEIPAGWIMWDRVIPWEKVAKVAKRWAHGTWIRAEEGYNSEERIIIPGQDAGEALVGVECWVWSNPGACGKMEVTGFDGVLYKIYDCKASEKHARPTYIGLPE